MVSGTQNNLHPLFELPLLSELFTYFFEKLNSNGKLFTGDEITLGGRSSRLGRKGNTLRRDDLCHTETLQIAYLRREGSNYFQNLCFSVSKEDDEGTVVTTHISVWTLSKVISRQGLPRVSLSHKNGVLHSSYSHFWPSDFLTMWLAVSEVSYCLTIWLSDY